MHLSHIHLTMSGSWLQKYGPVVGVMVGSIPHIIVSGVRWLREALHRDVLQGRSYHLADPSQREFQRRLGEFRLENFLRYSR
jgi:hypothetical protein